MNKLTHVSSEIHSIDNAPETPSFNSNYIDSTYTINNIVDEGSFLDLEALESIIVRWNEKKNLILQGPPGTGKTWLAKRLGYALIGKNKSPNLRSVQFHPNLSYEDFVRGWRPSGDGRLTLTDGFFMQVIKAALADSDSTHVVVIEEINRGNPAQIFGELLTLLEADKRDPAEALELSYADPEATSDDQEDRRGVHIPENLYVIGTMNIADRSLALVDLALRRRFAFITLEPRLGRVWQQWVVGICKVDPKLAENIERRMNSLNSKIASDPRLGKQFRIGHSYVTPASPLAEGETRKWFIQVVETEIRPLLDEYWFDAVDEVEDACNQLLLNW